MNTHQPLPKSSYFAWIMWIVGASFYFYEFLLQVFPNVVAHHLMEQLAVSAAALGGIQAAYFIGYGFMQAPAGMLLDRFGPRKLLTIAVILCGLGAIIFAKSTNVYQAEITRFITGFGSAFALVGALVLASRWFPANRFALLNGLIITIGMLGAAAGEAPFGLLVQKYDWQHIIVTLGFVGLVLGAIIYLVVRDYPKGQTMVSHKPEGVSAFSGIVNIFFCKQSWLIALYGSFMFASTPALGTLWGSSFLETTRGLPAITADSIITVLFIGWAVGAPLFGALSDRIGRRKPSLYMGSIGAFIFILLFIYQPHVSVTMLKCYMFLFGFFCGGFIVSFSVIRESHPWHFSGTSLGFMNLVNTVGAAASPLLVGILLDTYWDGTMVNHVQVFSAATYYKAITILPIFVGLSLLILPFIKETYCKGK